MMELQNNHNEYNVRDRLQISHLILSELINFCFPRNHRKTLGFLLIWGEIEVNSLNIGRETLRRFLFIDHFNKSSKIGKVHPRDDPVRKSEYSSHWLSNKINSVLCLLIIEYNHLYTLSYSFLVETILLLRKSKLRPPHLRNWKGLGYSVRSIVVSQSSSRLITLEMFVGQFYV